MLKRKENPSTCHGPSGYRLRIGFLHMNATRCLAMFWCLGLASAGEYHLAWSKLLPPRHPANQWNVHVPKDRSYRLVESDGGLLIAIPDESSLVCIDRASGAERWRYFAEAAIRQSPVVVGDAALVGSEDGTVACLGIADGSVRWRYRPGPGDRWIIAHDRLADAWPIMTPLAIADGAAFGVCGNFVEDGIWAFAIDLPSGKERWLRRLDVRVNSRPTIANGKAIFQGSPLAPARTFDQRTGAAIPEPPAVKAVAKPAATSADPTRAAKDDKPSEAARTARIAWLQEGIRFPALAPAIDLQAALADNFVVAVKPPASWTLHGPLPIAERPDSAAAWGPSTPLAPAETGLAGAAEAGTEILASGRFFMDEIGILLVNASADRSMRVLVDGQPIIDTLATGNGLPVSEASAHTGAIRLGEGEHVLTVRCRAGTDGWRCRFTLGRCDQDNGIMASAIAFPGHGFPGLIAPPPAAGSVDVLLPGGAMRPVARDRILPGIIQVAMDAQAVTALTSDGRLIGFTASRPESVRHVPPPSPPVPATIRSAIAVEGGWALVAGLEDGRTIERLIDERRWFRILAVDQDRTRVDAIRRRLADQGRLFDGRTQIIAVDRLDALPSWLADLVVSERSENDWAKLARCIKPYGGQLILPAGFAADRAQALAAAAGDVQVIDQAGVTAIVRPDGPAGSTGDWRERLGDAANTYGRADPVMRFPFATRWFGGASCGLRWYKGGADHATDEGIIWWGPMLIARGRWLLQGAHQIGCFDQYTGHKIWSAPIPEYPRGEDSNSPSGWTSVVASTGYRIADLSFGLAGYEQSCDDTTTYLAAAKELIAYDLATGAIRMRIAPPKELTGDLRWGRIQVSDHQTSKASLICSLFDPADNLPEGQGHDGGGMPFCWLAALDPATGSMRWQAKPRRAFGGVAVGGGRVYALDLVSPLMAQALAKAGRAIADAGSAEVVAFDLASGTKLWTRAIPICDTIVYDTSRDRVLVGARSLDPSELASLEGVHGGSTTATTSQTDLASVVPAKKAGLLLQLAGGDGSIVTQRQDLAYPRGSLVGDRMLLADGTLLSAVDGAVLQRPHPLTGSPATMKIPKGGCNTLVMSASFAGSRGFWNDLDSGLSGGGWGGQDYSCKPSFVPAGGLINVWNAGAQRFVNRTDTHSRTLEPSHRVTTWASNASACKALEPGWIRRLGVEPAAPGYRSDPAGGWWVPTDQQGRANLPGLNLRKGQGTDTPPASKRPYETADHRVVPAHDQADIPAWVSGFGLEDPGSLIVPTAYPEVPAGPAPRFRVRLIVSEPDEVAPGQRVFRVVCNGQTVVESLDVAAVAGGRQRSIVRDWQADGAQGVLRITYERTADSRLPPISGAILVERIAP
ncbi:hypothetical protein LBMAG53_31180 [Planctomycetota bacterium]|nr:hypothetical protein LBMAG53_31180 [Planctomycetota bacterium]